jgi:hypothetical protein
MIVERSINFRSRIETAQPTQNAAVAVQRQPHDFFTLVHRTDKAMADHVNLGRR